jgi:hemerythrin
VVGLITWKDEYSLGIENIDQQHKKLFEIAGRAYELLKDQHYLDKYDKIIEILDELKEYTVYHFNQEEEYMKSINYKKILSHKVQHDDFVEKVNNVDFRHIDDNQDKYITETLDFVLNWIQQHILGTDKLYAQS